MSLSRLRFIISALTLACALGSAQDWQKVTDLPGIELAGMNESQRSAALKILREQDCNCGCNLKIAECRVKDPQCGFSRKLATAVAQDIRAGKPETQVFANLRELQKQGSVQPKLLEDPVAIPTQGAPSIGPANARVTIVEFSDFQCPYCSIAAPKAIALAAQYPKDVRVIFKQFPLDFHSQAALAAEAALAAHAQGKFWPLHDKMFANFRQIRRETILAWARESGLDMKAFEADLASGKHKNTVQREQNEGVAAGVMGTPTFFVNGKRYNGPFELQNLKPIIDAELQAASGSPRIR